MTSKNTVLKTLLLLLVCKFNLYGQDNIAYPKAMLSNQTDTIWHTVVKDPYRWMENIKTPEVKEWLDEEEKICKKYDGRTPSLHEYIEFYSETEFKPLIRRGKYYFSFGYFTEKETPELFYQKKIGAEPQFLFDPNKLGKYSSYGIEGLEMSGNNNTLALTLSKNGSDWRTIRFLDMNSEKLLPDTINFVKYTDITWFNNGVFYCKYNVKNIDESFKGLIKGEALYYHKLGTSQKEDILVYKPDSAFDDIDFSVSQKNRYIVLYRTFYTDGKKYYAVSYSNLNDSLRFAFKDFIVTPKDELYFDVLGKLNGKLLVQTNLDAPNGAIYKYDPSGINKAERFIGQSVQQLNFSKIMQNKIINTYSNDTISIGLIRDSTGKVLTKWAIPDGNTFSKFTGGENDSILIYYFHSFFTPPSVYQMNINNYKTEPLAKTYINFNIQDLITRKVYYKSKDGTVIPMYLTYKKGIKLDGKNPTLLYGYGGFGIKMEPFFEPANIFLLRTGGILATPCLRGGGDYPGWHEKGMRLNKQNTFDDFIAAAEYLISNKYTSPENMAAMGGSNGGLLVGAVMTQRPDLFKAVVCISGVLDMLRYHLYNIGYLWKDEYGNITDSTDFRNLIKYSPVHNVKSGVSYPATLLVAGDNDDRVNPFNSFKFLAALQANSSSANPYILYYRKNAGHMGSDVIENDVEAETYIYAFIFKYLGIEHKIVYDGVDRMEPGYNAH